MLSDHIKQILIEYLRDVGIPAFIKDYRGHIPKKYSLDGWVRFSNLRNWRQGTRVEPIPYTSRVVMDLAVRQSILAGPWSTARLQRWSESTFFDESTLPVHLKEAIAQFIREAEFDELCQELVKVLDQCIRETGVDELYLELVKALGGAMRGELCSIQDGIDAVMEQPRTGRSLRRRL